jgi:hypothetical protein
VTAFWFTPFGLIIGILLAVFVWPLFITLIVLGLIIDLGMLFIDDTKPTEKNGWNARLSKWVELKLNEYSKRIKEKDNGK